MYKYHKVRRYKKQNKAFNILCDLLPAMILGVLGGFVLAMLYLMGKAQGIY